MNAVIYARYSSDNQREESIDGQLRECGAFAEKNGMTVIGNYIDRALSAKTDNRPDFQRMIKDSAKKQFEVIIVWKLDRFARDRYDSAHYKRILKQNSVKVISATEPIAEGSTGIILESLLEGFSEYYSVELAEKVIRGQPENALKCKFNGGTIPYGFLISPEKQFKINPAQAPFVIELFKRYDSGDSITELVDDFKTRGIKNQKGTFFTINTIGNVLRNRRYIGEYKYRDVVIPKGIPALVDNELFERVQKRMDANARIPARGKAKEEYLLTTKLFCGTCKRMMVGESGKSRNGTVHYYYKCAGNKKYKDCTRKAIKKEWIEDIVVERTRVNILEDDAAIDKIADDIMLIQEKEDDITPALKAQLADCETKLKNIMSAIENGVFNKYTNDRMAELDAQKNELLISIAEQEIMKPKFTKEAIVVWIKQFREGNPKNFKYRKRLIDSFVNAVYIYDDKIIFTYNFKKETETISLEEIESVFGSDTSMCTPPGKFRFRRIGTFCFAYKQLFFYAKHFKCNNFSFL